MVAFIIDAILLSLAVPVAWFLGITSFGLLTPILTLALALLPLAYHSLMISSARGRTFGQAAMGLRVMDKDGNPPQLVQAAILTMLFYATLVFTSGLLLIWCLFDDKQRCLHDILAGTMTVRSDRI